MATETETVVPHPSVDPVDEQETEKIVDEVKAVEEETSTPCKDIGEDDSSIKLKESPLISSILDKSEEEEVTPTLESPTIEIKAEEEAANEENDQFEPIPESQTPEEIKPDIKEALDPLPRECIEQLIDDGSVPVREAAPAVETEPEESADEPVISIEPLADSPANKVNDQIEPIPQSQTPEEIKPVVKEAIDPPPAECVEKLIYDGSEPVGVAAPVESAEEPVISIEPLAGSVEPSHEQDDQPITDPQVQEGPLTDTPAEKEQDDQPSVESAIQEEEKEPGLTSAERELDNKPYTEAVIREEEDEQPPEESVLKETDEKEQEEPPSVDLVIEEAEDQLAVGSAAKIPKDQPLENPTVEEVKDQPEVEQEDQPPVSANSSPAFEVESEPPTKMEEPVSVLPGEELEPAIVKETTYSDSGATNDESEPTTTIEKEQPEPVLPGEELEPAIVKETTYSDSGAAIAESEPTTTIEKEHPEPVLPEEELEPATVKETTYSDSAATNVESEPTAEIEQPVSVFSGEELEPAIVKETTYSDSGATNVESEPTTTIEKEQPESILPVEELEPAIVKEATNSDSAATNVESEPTMEIEQPVFVLPEKEIEAPIVKETIDSESGPINNENPQQETARLDDEQTEQLQNTEEASEPQEDVSAETVKDEGKLAVDSENSSMVKDEEVCKEVKKIENYEEERIEQSESAGEDDSTPPIPESIKEEVNESSTVEIVEKLPKDVLTDEKTAEEDEETIVNTERSVELSTEQIADADQITKHDVKNQEPPKNEGDESKSSENQQKEVPSKPAQKHSNNILSKVKQSLVKAKKAIIGKSPGSKNLPSETKGDIQVK